jgi:uncharacterized Ntn-hydrolase superfamily protein
MSHWFTLRIIRMRESLSIGAYTLKIPNRVAVTLAVLLLVLPRSAHATWSIVILDREHKWIGVAAASCTPDVYGIMSLRPGQGVLLAQAVGNDAAIQRGNKLLATGLTSDSVVQILVTPANDSASWYRQYAVASFTGGLAQFTGDSTAGYHGALQMPDVLVQGNSLPGPHVLARVMAAIQTAQRAKRTLPEVLMAALSAGAKAGGDVRCGSQRATSAFLVVARPGEKPFLPYLTLSVFGAEKGGANAVNVLSARLNRWLSSGGPNNPITSEGVQPASSTKGER